MAVVYAVLVVLAVLCASEWGWRRHWLKGELGRKFIHILVGTFVAFWPFFLTWNQIRLLSVAFLVSVIVSHYFRIFTAIESVQRPTYGEIFFALVVGLLTFITHSKGIYAAALLQMSLADGLAAIIGTWLGGNNSYRLLGNRKSVAGTMTFLLVSFGLLIGYGLFSAAGLSTAAAAVICVAATAIENLGAFGIDNLLVPLLITLLLAD